MLDLANIRDFSLFVLYFFYIVLLPGYLLTRAVVPPKQLRESLKTLPNIEKNLFYRYFYYLFAPAIGLILTDAVVLVMAKLHWALSFNSFFIGFSIVNVFLLLVNGMFSRSPKVKRKVDNTQDTFYFIFIALILGSVLIRTVFYLPDVVPGSTDLGHHMYWSQWMVEKETFPRYDTPEVIEGEHMVFAVLGKLSGVTLLSAMPLIVLSFYNLMMLLALSFTSLSVTANRNVFLWTLFFSGIFSAVDPPQARYVKGGVIGNTFGNLFIPLVFLLVFLFFRWWFQSCRKDKTVSSYKAVASLVSLILIIIAGSFYTHHLSTFLLGISLAVSFIAWIIITLLLCRDRSKTCLYVVLGRAKALFKFFRETLLSLKFILTLLAVVIFPLFIYIPHYLYSNAVETVAQAPEKETHLGITLNDYIGKMGWTRFSLLILSFIFLVICVFVYLNKRYQFSCRLSLFKFLKYVETGFSTTGGSASGGKPVSIGAMFLLILGWFLPLALLSFYPEIFKIDLPSRRVVNYLIFPGIILAAVAADWLFSRFVKKIKKKHLRWAFFLLAAAVLWDGTADFRSVYSGQNKFQDTVELYDASVYLASSTQDDAVILKDHRTIAGDSWIKFFFLRGYDYFLSRTYDYKYNDAGNGLDPCTRETIIVPNSSVAEQCYGQTRISYVIVKPAGDDFLFWKGKNFNAIYLNDDIAVFKKNEN